MRAFQVISHLCLLLAIGVTSCAGVGYYLHAGWGGLRLVSGARSIEKMVADPEVSEDLKARLSLIHSMRDFASQELGLPDNESYRKYKNIGRTYATWTVVAAPELSLQPVEWCFPFAGCVSYRGYFSAEKAERFAAELEATGFDVDFGGVRAYSTLGWFADPVLNTFLDLPTPDLLGLLVHELAHQELYVKGATAFNESFATAVEIIGVNRWLQNTDEETVARFLTGKRRQGQFMELVARVQDSLTAVYAADQPEPWKRAEKDRLFTQMRSDFSNLAAEWGGSGGFESWFDEGLNNARLISIGVYQEYLPGFCGLLVECDGSLDCFFEKAHSLAVLEAEDRATALTGSVSGQVDFEGCLMTGLR